MDKGPQYFNGKRWVGGSAAWNHFISQDGGWNEHHSGFLAEYDKHKYEEFIKEYNRRLEKPNLKVVK